MIGKLAGAAIAALTLGVAAADAAVITVTPGQANLQPGDSVSVSIDISGLTAGGAPSLGTFDLDLVYDPSILSFQSAAFGDQLDILGLGSLQSADGGVAGTVNLFELSFDLASDLDALQADAFTLATLTFSATATGLSSLMVSLLALGDSDGNPLSASVRNASVAVSNASPVPLPGAAWLMLAGLFWLGMVSRRRFAAAVDVSP